MSTSQWSSTNSLTTKASYVPTSQTAKLVGNTGINASDQFGYSIAISGDGLYIAVGAYTDDTFSTNAGAVYIFFKSGGSWTQQAKFYGNSVGSNSYFSAYGISLTQDGSRLVASQQNGSYGAGSGRTYVFARTGSSWTQEAILERPNGGGSDYGVACAISGDGLTVAIGAHGWNSYTGLFSIFTRSGTAWSYRNSFVASDPSTSSLFGYSISLNYNGMYVIVGAYGVLNNTGAAYIFYGNLNAYTQQAKLIASDGVFSDYFGYAVAIDYNANRVIIGSYIADPSNVSNAGKAYVFSRSGTTWTQEAILSASNKTTNSYFGYSVDISDNGDVVVVGAYAADPGGITDAGSAYVFSRIGTTWSEQTILSASDKASSDTFGRSVGISGDKVSICVGANLDDITYIDQGSTYVFT